MRHKFASIHPFTQLLFPGDWTAYVQITGLHGWSAHCGQRSQKQMPAFTHQDMKTAVGSAAHLDDATAGSDVGPA